MTQPRRSAYPTGLRGNQDARGLGLLLLLAMAVSFFLGLGSVPLFDLDEGAFTEATREMLLRRDFVSTWLNGVPRFDKPVLIYWLQAASVSLFGQSEWSFRLPSALCACLWVGVVFAFVNRLRGRLAGLMAAGFTATAAGITVIGRAAIADALLNALIAAAMASAFLYLTEKDRRWLYATFAAIGLGLLAKGPVAILVPLAVTGLFCLTRRDLGGWLRAVFDWRALALMLLIAAPWYIAQYVRMGDAFIQGFFMKHNVDRFSAPMHGFNGSLFFYLPWLLVATLPFTAPLLNLLRRARLIWADELQRFCLIWFLFVLVFFSLSGTKLPHYVFYGYSGLFILMALNLPSIASHRLALLVPLLLFAAVAALPWVLPFTVSLVKDPYYQEALNGIQGHFGVAFHLSCGAAILITLVMMWMRGGSLAGKLLVAGTLQAALLAVFILPAVAEAQQSPIREAALVARERGDEVVMWKLDTPSFIVYSGRLVQKRDPRPGDVVLTRRTRLAEIGRHEVLYQKNGIALVKLDAALAGQGPEAGKRP